MIEGERRGSKGREGDRRGEKGIEEERRGGERRGGERRGGERRRGERRRGGRGRRGVTKGTAGGWEENELAERAVQTVKNALRKTSGDIDTCLSRFLFQYRLTPHSTTGRSPAELLLGRKPARTWISFSHLWNIT